MLRTPSTPQWNDKGMASASWAVGLKWRPTVRLLNAIEIEIDEPSDNIFEVVSGTLGTILAPRGSSLYVPNHDRRLNFGAHEGLALYLNGTELRDDVYRDYDSNYVYEECSRLLEGIGVVSSHWQDPTETAIYMYGWDFTSMQTRLAPFLQAYPLCQQCRVTQIA